MPPLRILLVMIEPPLPFGNAAARWFYVLLKGLVERGHRVTAFAACSNPADIPKSRALFPAPQYDLRLYPFPTRRGLGAKLATLRRPYSYMFSDELKADLETELAAGYDVFHLEQLWCGWLALRHRERAVLNVLSLYAIDLEASPPATWGARVQRYLLISAERRLLRAYPRLLALSERIAERIRELAPRTRVEVSPFGIDTALYDYIPDERRTTEPVVGVIGSMNWHPSRSAAVRLLARLWPEIKRRVPAARAEVVGWGAKSALAEFASLPDVAIEENVPDTRPYFARMGVLLYAPGRGSGIKVKVLEALAYGVPVVTTSEGVEALPAVDGLHAGIADDDAGLIECTIRLLADPAARNRQRAAGRALLEAHCGPEPTLRGIEAIYEGMLRERR